MRQPKPPRIRNDRGYAVVTFRVDGQPRNYSLGPWGTPGVLERYRQLLSQWQAGTMPRRAERPPLSGGTGIRIDDLCVRYVRWCRQQKVSVDHLANVRAALSLLTRHHGATRVDVFGPSALRVLRDSMLRPETYQRDGKPRTRPAWSTETANKRTGVIVRAFRWGVSWELVPSSVGEALATVDPLYAEPHEPRPISQREIDAVRAKLDETTRDMVDVQLLTGMRPGEVCAMRWSDIDTSGKVWLYAPQRHKGTRAGRRRVIALGPRAQDILQRHKVCDMGIVFVQCDRGAYRRDRYGKLIAAACEAASTTRLRISWTAHQLRHTAATRIRKAYGLAAAAAVLGHSSATLTDATYAQRDVDQIAQIALEVG